VAARQRARLFDTTVYIAAIRSGERQALERLSGPLVWLSSVVSFELLAGTKSDPERAQLQRLVEAYRRRGRLLIPTDQEWQRAGDILARYGAAHGKVQPYDHVGDVLITLTAARLAGEVVTGNLVDFRRWAGWVRRSGGDVTVSDRL
jgi:predicted nucleic acid-binding protein